MNLRPQAVSKLLLHLEAEGRIRIARTGRANVYTLIDGEPDGDGENQVLPPEHLPNNGASAPELLGKYPLRKAAEEREEYGFPLGRTRELKLLEDYIRKGLSVVVQGAEGVGKTAVLRAFCSKAKALHREPLYIPQG